MIRVFQVKCAYENEVEAQLIKKLHIKKEDLLGYTIHRRSVDARHQKVLFSYVIDCSLKNEKKVLKHKDVQPCPDETYHFVSSGTRIMNTRPVVVGFGPAGMFASLILAEAGYQPIVVERGSMVSLRKEKVDTFWQTGKLDPECNVQFGEGGAGAFSDGKLTTRSKDSRARKVLEELVDFGAKEDILIDAHPHIGTDAFLKIIENCRKKIIDLGGTFYFDTCLKDIKTKQNKLAEIKINDTWIPCENMILTIGHSATDTIRMLHQNGVMMENKPYAIGVRIEHKQEYINRAMLKDYATDPRLIPARYQLTHTASNNKGVYTFCMCPGGYVIPSSSSKEKLVVNGMSYASRSGENANSALLVQVNEEDYGNELFAGLQYQEDLDALGYQFVDLNELFDPAINQALHEALIVFEKRVPGFVSEGALLSAVESRSSSSVRIIRDHDLQSNIQGIYPGGEGAGYAGGIMTSAIDGIKCAESIICQYQKHDTMKQKTEG